MESLSRDGFEGARYSLFSLLCDKIPHVVNNVKEEKFLLVHCGGEGVRASVAQPVSAGSMAECFTLRWGP